MARALITGVSGQDGSYLAELLAGMGYEVTGVTRDPARARTGATAAALAGVELLDAASFATPGAIRAVVASLKPDEVYHLAGPSGVSASWADRAGTREGIATATAALLDGLATGWPAARCFVAGSCEMFAASDQPADEAAPLEPGSPYGDAKLAAFRAVRASRDAGLYAVTGILFNHESPRRGESFVTRKITRAAARIALGRQQGLRLGNLDVRRDWGFAGDYVRAMWLMLRQDAPEDLVIGTGTAHAVSAFCEAAFTRAGLDWRSHVAVDPALVRRDDAPLRLADPARARRRLGWSPEVDFQRLVEMMVDADLRAARAGLAAPGPAGPRPPGTHPDA